MKKKLTFLFLFFVAILYAESGVGVGSQADYRTVPNNTNSQDWNKMLTEKKAKIAEIKKNIQDKYGNFSLGKFLMSDEIYTAINKTTENVVRYSFLVLAICFFMQLLIDSIENWRKNDSSEDENRHIKSLKKFIILALFLASYYYIIPWVGSIISSIARLIFPETNDLSDPLSNIIKTLYGDKNWMFFVNIENLIGYLSFKLLSITVSIVSVGLYVLQGLFYCFGALSIALSMVDFLANSWKKWISSFIILGFWGVSLAILLNLIASYSSILSTLDSVIKPGYDFFSTSIYGKLVIINILMILLIIYLPKLTSCYIEANSSSIGEIGTAITGLATAGAGLAMAGAKMGMTGGASAVSGGAKGVASYMKKISRAQNIGKIMRG